MKKVHFRKNGYIIEFPKLGISFARYLFARTTAFLVDIALFIALQMVLYFVFKTNIIFSIFFGFATFLVYNLFCASLLRTKTLGMFIARLQIINYDGYPATRNRVTVRMFIYSIYAVPFLGWFLVIVSLIAILLTRGMSFVDVVSKTQVASVDFSMAMARVYESINSH